MDRTFYAWLQEAVIIPFIRGFMWGCGFWLAFVLLSGLRHLI